MGVRGALSRLYAAIDVSLTFRCSSLARLFRWSSILRSESSWHCCVSCCFDDGVGIKVRQFILMLILYQTQQT